MNCFAGISIVKGEIIRKCMTHVFKLQLWIGDSRCGMPKCNKQNFKPITEVIENFIIKERASSMLLINLIFYK